MTDLNQLKFTKTHEWFRLEQGQATVGITQHAQEEISDVVFVELPKPGKQVAKGDEVAVVESVKAAFSIYAPVAGTISGVNETLTQDPGQINGDPYGKGWIYRLGDLKPEEAQSLFDAQQYADFVKGESKAHS